MRSRLSAEINNNGDGTSAAGRLARILASDSAIIARERDSVAREYAVILRVDWFM